MVDTFLYLLDALVIHFVCMGLLRHQWLDNEGVNFTARWTHVMMSAITKAAKGLDPHGDMLIVRLPIAQVWYSRSSVTVAL